jgi:GrpB-like predicted nucleotidyltransferase (UPF0157 family)
MLGLHRGTVKLTPHSEVWHQLFAEEAARLRDAVGEHVLAIEHVGSTAVCGLSAKPIIDIAVAVRGVVDVGRRLTPLENIGYEHRGEWGIPGRRLFVKGEPRTHHLHMVEAGGDLWRNYLLFRDRLRRSAEVAEAYERLKRELAREHEDDREAYTAGKASFIEDVLRAVESDGA